MSDKVALFEEQIALLKDYVNSVEDSRKAVVKYGAESMTDFAETEEEKPFYIFVGTYLSPQTRDQMTYQAVKNLKEKFHGITAQKLSECDVNDIKECIKCVGFYNRKSIALKKCCQILINEYDGKIPDTAEELVKLPGVGMKIASIIVALCYKKYESLAVDTHVFVISNRLNWANANTAEKTRTQLEAWLPHEYWEEFNYYVVAFGQCCCGKAHPKCTECPLTKYCSYYKPIKVKKGNQVEIDGDDDVNEEIKEKIPMDKNSLPNGKQKETTLLDYDSF